MSTFETDAIHAIHDVLARYASGADWVDEAMFSDVFSEDAVIDFGAFCVDKNQYVKIIMGFGNEYTRRWHHFGHPRIVVTASAAVAESTCVAHMRRSYDETDEIYFGRYLFSLSRNSRKWRVTRLTYMMSLEQRLPVRMSQSELRRAESLNNLHPLFGFRNGSVVG